MKGKIKLTHTGYKVVRVPLKGPGRRALLSYSEGPGWIRYYVGEIVRPHHERNAAVENGPICLFKDLEQAVEFLRECPDDDWREYRLYKARYLPSTRTFKGLKIWSFKPAGPDDFDPMYEGSTAVEDWALADAVKLVERIHIDGEDRPYDPWGHPQNLTA